MEYALAHPGLTFWMVVLVSFFAFDAISSFSKRTKITNSTVYIRNEKEREDEG